MPEARVGDASTSPEQRGKARDLRAQVARSFRVIVAAMAASLLVSIVLAFVTLRIYEREIQNKVEGIRAVATAHEAMLDQETGLRGYLLTHDSAFLDPYRDGRIKLTNANRSLDDLLAGDKGPGTLFTSMRVAEERWTSEWADSALAKADAGETVGSGFLAKGKRLFDAYRATENELSSSLAARVADVQRTERFAFAIGLALEIALLAAVIAFALSQRRRLRDESEERSAEMAFHTGSLRRLLTLVRDFTSTLDPAELLATIGKGAKSVSGYERVGVWLTESGATPTLAFGDLAGAGASADDSVARQVIALGKAVMHPDSSFGAATPIEAPSRLALPMIAGGRVIGVLELEGPTSRQLPSGALELFETLAGQAATALQAARLYRETAQMSQTDGLTGLLNRRRLDDDLNYELARSERYGNQLTFVLFDLDNFKQFNDTHGHQEGDEVLRDVGRILSSSLRRTDSAYRYGGDELSVLLRETPAEAGARLADRIRQRVAEHFAAELPPITASFGVADPVAAGSHDPDALVRVADANLYAAKRRGRNRVVFGSPEPVRSDAVVRDIRERRGG